MFGTDEIRAKLRTVPFEPFRIVMTSGQTYDVRRPDSMLVTTNVLYVGIYKPHRPEEPDRAASVSLAHLAEIIPLPAGDTPAGTN